MEFDIDWEELNDPYVRGVMKRLGMNRYATYRNDSLGRRISRIAQPYRKVDPPVLVISNDRKTNMNSIAINENLFLSDAAIAKIFKDLLKGLK
jgi:hypothetical protein